MISRLGVARSIIQVIRFIAVLIQAREEPVIQSAWSEKSLAKSVKSPSS
jgi:hypothetical protein